MYLFHLREVSSLKNYGISKQCFADIFEKSQVLNYQEKKVLYFWRKLQVQGVLGLHEFWAREKLVQAKFVLVKLCTSSFVKLCAGKFVCTCHPRNGLNLKICATVPGFRTLPMSFVYTGLGNILMLLRVEFQFHIRVL